MTNPTPAKDLQDDLLRAIEELEETDFEEIDLEDADFEEAGVEVIMSPKRDY